MADPPSSGSDPTGGGGEPTSPIPPTTPGFPASPPTFGTGPTGGGPVLTTDPVISESGPRTTRWLMVAISVVILAVGVGAAILLWPDGDDDDTAATAEGDDSGLSVGTGGPSDDGGPGPGPADPEDPDGPDDPEQPGAPADLIQTDPIPALAGFRQAIGAPFLARSLVLYDEYAILEYQDPEAPTHIDRRTWWADRMDGPSPVSLSQGFTPDVEAELFDLGDVRFPRVPAMADEALAAFESLENPVVSHVIVDKVFSDDDIVVRVYVNDPERGGGGYVEFTPNGRQLEVIR